MCVYLSGIRKHLLGECVCMGILFELLTIIEYISNPSSFSRVLEKLIQIVGNSQMMDLSEVKRTC